MLPLRSILQHASHLPLCTLFSTWEVWVADWRRVTSSCARQMTNKCLLAQVRPFSSSGPVPSDYPAVLGALLPSSLWLVNNQAPLFSHVLYNKRKEYNWKKERSWMKERTSQKQFSIYQYPSIPIVSRTFSLAKCEAHCESSGLHPVRRKQPRHTQGSEQGACRGVLQHC